MDRPNSEIEGIAFVVIGSFNPAIFHPSWLLAQNLIRREEAESAKIQVVHPNATSFAIGSVELQVTADRLSVSTNDAASYEFARDLTMGSLRILSHTPVRSMGMNKNFHFSMPSEEMWHAVGHRLTPKEPWAGILEQPGMVDITMEGKRPDEFNGYIRVSVQPSGRIKPGVFISVNDHYQYDHKDSTPSQGCDVMVNIITSNWGNFLDLSNRISSSIIGFV